MQTTNEQQCQGLRGNSIKKALRLAKEAGLFLFRGDFLIPYTSHTILAPATRTCIFPTYRACELPSSPRPVIEVREEGDRPQPRLDRLTGNGMMTVVGRVRRDSILD